MATWDKTWTICEASCNILEKSCDKRMDGRVSIIAFCRHHYGIIRFQTNENVEISRQTTSLRSCEQCKRRSPSNYVVSVHRLIAMNRQSIRCRMTAQQKARTRYKNASNCQAQHTNVKYENKCYNKASVFFGYKFLNSNSG